MEFTEVEDRRLMRRSQVFQQEGLPEPEAMDLAYQLLVRDREGLDMRVCFECKHLERNRYCLKLRDGANKPQLALRFTLQRCPDFKLKEAKK